MYIIKTESLWLKCCVWLSCSVSINLYSIKLTCGSLLCELLFAHSGNFYFGITEPSKPSREKVLVRPDFIFRSICFLLLIQFRAVGWGLEYTRWVSLSQGQHKDRKKEKHWKQFSQHAYFWTLGHRKPAQARQEEHACAAQKAPANQWIQAQDPGQ